jgi:MFS transporter, DHA2 family, multidrug resistance protein
MSAGATGAGASAAASGASANPWLIAALVSLATFMEVLDITVANVALRYIAGGMDYFGALLRLRELSRWIARLC